MQLHGNFRTQEVVSTHFFTAFYSLSKEIFKTSKYQISNIQTPFPPFPSSWLNTGFFFLTNSLKPGLRKETGFCFLHIIKLWAWLSGHVKAFWPIYTSHWGPLYLSCSLVAASMSKSFSVSNHRTVNQHFCACTVFWGMPQRMHLVQ